MVRTMAIVVVVGEVVVKIPLVPVQICKER